MVERAKSSFVEGQRALDGTQLLLISIKAYLEDKAFREQDQ